MRPPRVFVTWAHADDGWTQQQRREWATTIAQFAAELVANGVDADVDLYHLSDTRIDWTRYGPKAIAGADYVVAALSKAWNRRFEGVEVATIGAGASQEADVLLGLYQRDRDEFHRKVILVALPGTDTADVPLMLRGVLRFTIDALTPAHMIDLLRALHGEPEYVRPALGNAPDFRQEGTATDEAHARLNNLLVSLGSPSGASVPRSRETEAAIEGVSDVIESIGAKPQATSVTSAVPDVAPPSNQAVRYSGNFVMPPNGKPNTWAAEPLLRLRTVTLVAPATVDSVGRLGPSVHAAVTEHLDAAPLTRALRGLSRQLVPVLADDPLSGPAPRQPLEDWSIARDDHITGDHAAYRLGGDASAGIVAFMSVSLPAFSHAGQINLVMDVGASVAEQVSILAIGRVLSDMLATLLGSISALGDVVPGDARAGLTSVMLTAPRTDNGQFRENSLEHRIAFESMGERTRSVNFDIGASFNLWPGASASAAPAVIVGAVEQMMIDAGFLDPTLGIEVLRVRLGA